MDFESLKNQVTNLTIYDLKAGFRKAQNAVMNYTPMEAKVREATTNDPWGASASLMSEIANGTFNYQTLNEIMPMIYKRFTEKTAEEWRQIYKALQLLEYLIKHGSERVIDDARGHLSLLKMLRQFHYIDTNGKDQGINVRNRSKELSDLLGDVEKIRSERKKARTTKNKYSGVEGGAGVGGAGSSRYGGFGSETPSGDYGGYSGGVYGDGGGFGGATSEDYSETTGRRERFEEYDEFDDGGAMATPGRRKADSSAARTSKPQPPKPKEPEVDLFDFSNDDPAVTATSAMPPSNGKAPAIATTEDDEFDDFQSATKPNTTTTTIPTTTQFASPTPGTSHSQAAGINNILSTISPPPSTTGTPVSGGANYAAFGGTSLQPAFAQPAMNLSTQAPKPTGFQQAQPNYFTTVNAASTPAMSPGIGKASPAPGQAAKPTKAAGGDPFATLMGGGAKKSGTVNKGPALGDLAKQKASAGLWGATTSAPQGGGSGGGGDLL